jgi:hypothetical protein
MINIHKFRINTLSAQFAMAICYYILGDHLTGDYVMSHTLITFGIPCDKYGSFPSDMRYSSYNPQRILQPLTKK